MKNPETPQDVLENAIEYIDMLGWTQGSYQKGHEGPVCAVGALTLGVVNGEERTWAYAQSKVETNMRLKTLFHASRSVLDSVSGGSVIRYNDYYAKTKRGVLNRMRAAIEKLNAE